MPKTTGRVKPSAPPGGARPGSRRRYDEGGKVK